MTIIAGMYAIYGEIDRYSSLWQSMKNVMSRNPEDTLVEFSNRKCCMAKIDVGAFENPAINFVDDSSFSMLAGEPLVVFSDGKKVPRNKALELFHDSLRDNQGGGFERSRGMFCSVFYVSGTLYLVTDKLGLRPLYYLTNGGVFLFASAQRIFEESDVQLNMSLMGTCEKIVYGIPLGNRTEYDNLFCTKDAEVVKVCGDKIEIKRYWERWWEYDENCDNTHEKDIPAELFNKFVGAVSLRLGNDRRIRAFLSGGLDSRCVVAGVRECGADAITYNFSRENTYDQLLSMLFAKDYDLQHNTVTLKESEAFRQHSEYLNKFFPYNEISKKDILYPQLVWTGDGGSVCAGCVYLNDSMVSQLRVGKTKLAIKTLLQFNGWGISTRVLKDPPFKEIESKMISTVARQLDTINTVDPAKKIYVFLILNDQRKHFFNHLQMIDLSRIEYISPFFDPELIVAYFQIPIDDCLYHNMYMKWIRFFKFSITETPWQAYAGHVPCHIALPTEGRNQWEVDKKYWLGKRKYLLEKVRNEIDRRCFPDSIIDKMTFFVSVLTTRYNLRDCSHILEQSLTLNKIWRVCEGRYVDDLL